MEIYALLETCEGPYIYKLSNEGKLIWRMICSVDYLNSMGNDPKILCYKIACNSWSFPKYIEFKKKHLQSPLVEI